MLPDPSYEKLIFVTLLLSPSFSKPIRFQILFTAPGIFRFYKDGRYSHTFCKDRAKRPFPFIKKKRVLMQKRTRSSPFEGRQYWR